MWSDRRLQKRAGFTLIEMIITLMITAFIGVGVTYGVVYGVKLYRATASIGGMMDQAEVAMNVVAEQLRANRADKVQWDEITQSLTMDEEKLLGNVQAYSVKVLQVPNTNKTLFRVHLTLSPSVPGGEPRVFEFDIYPRADA